MTSQRFHIACMLIALWLSAQTANAFSDSIRKRFVDLRTLVPSAAIDIRYYTSNNFIGTRIQGYLTPTCILTQEAASALRRVQRQLKPKNLGVRIYDCYRPQSAVNQFVRWANDLQNQKTKAAFYPRVPKNDLIIKGYIASRSGHSRGSTVDLTLVERPDNTDASGPTDPRPLQPPLNMGTPFDFFDRLSHTDSPMITGDARNNRLLLKSVMEQNGFKNLPEEWWHYTLVDEPFKHTYFDFPVE